ncbi:MAG: PIN domain-containing protein [Thermodesulfobacteriota bacterium]|nr:PIN domain-containing protein [Thermodesulfobacteriota bacterium]
MKRSMEKGPIRVFLDSNVILSGLFSDKGSPRIILDLLCLGLPFIVGVTGRYNVVEIERNLKRKMPRAIPTYKRYLPELNLEIIPIPSKKEIQGYYGLTSDKDVPVLVSAIKGNANFFITGDKKHFSKLKEHGRLKFKILSPSEFLEIFVGLYNDFQVK